MSTPFHLQIPRSLYEEMIAQALSELPNECCGLFAGRMDQSGADDRTEEAGRVAIDVPVIRAERRYVLVNESASPVEFTSDPRSMLTAVRDMRDRGIDIVAVYHSHPTSRPIPSRKDLERNLLPGAMCLIISLAGEQPEVRAWWLSETSYDAAPFEIVP